MNNSQSAALIPTEQIILIIRNERVIVDADLAKLYGVSTKALNQAVKRNSRRFPTDFMFQLTKQEGNELVTICDRFRNLKYSTSLPNAFSEHGAIMAASILNSARAIDASIYVVRAFVRLRKIIENHKEFAQKLAELEMHIAEHDSHIQSLFVAIRQLAEPPIKSKRPIGFRYP